MLSKTDNDTNNVTNTPATDVLNKKTRLLQSTGSTRHRLQIHNGGLERVTIELVPTIILEEEEDGLHQWADQYDSRDNTSYTLVKKTQ